MTAAADFHKGQTDMSYIGEQQTLNRQSMRYQICSGEISRGRSNCGATYCVSIYY